MLLAPAIDEQNCTSSCRCNCRRKLWEKCKLCVRFWLIYRFAYSMFAAQTQIFKSDPRKITRQERILTSAASVYKRVCMYLSMHLSIPYVMHTEYFKSVMKKKPEFLERQLFTRVPRHPACFVALQVASYIIWFYMLLPLGISFYAVRSCHVHSNLKLSETI